MQQVSAQLTNQAASTQGTQALPFNFGMTAEEGQNFYEILQQTVSDLQEGNLDNNEIAEQLDFIKQNIPSELMTKLEEELNLNQQLDSEDELSATAFAVLNLVDNIIENIEQVETKPQLQESMEQSGISENNIATAFNIIEKPLENKQALSTEALATAQKIETTTTAAINSQAQQNIAQFKANELPASQFFSEKLITGEKIVEPITMQNQAALNTKEITKPTTEIATEVAETETIEIANATKTEAEVSKPSKSMAEILSLFKKTKDTAEATGLNLDKPKTQAANNEVIANNIKTTEVKQDIAQTATTMETTKVAAQMQQEAITRQEEGKTSGAINKSEFKELASKFVAELNSENTEKSFNPEQTKTETTAAINAVNPITLNKATSINKAMPAVKFENFEVMNMIQAEQAATQTAEAAENKALASNFNMHLYKAAQQAGIQNQINVAIRNFKAGNQQLKIKLNPEELGSITIDMEMVDNMARGTITVERPEVAQQLAQNLNKMFEGFKQSGINLNDNDIVIKLDEEPKNNQTKQEFTEDDQPVEKEVELTLSENELDIQV